MSAAKILILLLPQSQTYHCYRSAPQANSISFLTEHLLSLHTDIPYSSAVSQSQRLKELLILLFSHYQARSRET